MKHTENDIVEDVVADLLVRNILVRVERSRLPEKTNIDRKCPSKGWSPVLPSGYALEKAYARYQ